MKYGVLTFSYANFAGFARAMKRNGVYSINLGDFMQTLATRSVYRRLGVADADVIAVDRDTIAGYSGPPVVLPMNGCFYDWCFPLPETITPLFVGFQARAGVIDRFHEYLARFQPIGCRDAATARALRSHGVQAYVTGCLTLALPPREAQPEERKTLVVYGAKAGRLPSELLPFAPRELFADLGFVSQRKHVHRFPLDEAGRADAERHAAHLLRTYRKSASLVITPLHHAATPCIASGVPVVIARAIDDSRFSFLRSLLPVYLPEDFGRIDWSPRPVDVEPVRARLIEEVRRGLNRIGMTPAPPAQPIPESGSAALRSA
ncbi:polysaccharide pyruvyl transferase family protein [Hansschlegelia sp.]|uniref:polysaccharide pyruvyl transferase family protein n=1 Tax=Hansschlegelia sp. TaxID=2041892 RepID=UPI002BCA4623|nr:polysaccharide pyruvyl transferase family protein [Hansschlegelia sp.]HVI27475.1 polysaccharide pyruvyl transferase family protein [Hansschlegelia sp.]